MIRTRMLSEALLRTALFRDQSPLALDAICAAMQEVRFSSGQLIFARGDPGHALYLVCGGRVRLSILTAEGRELSFAHAVAGDIFGEIAVLDGSSRSADATALSPVDALALSSQDFNRLVDQHSTLARSVIRFLCARLRTVSDHLEDIALLPLEARLARFILNQIATAHEGTPQNSGTFQVALGMSQSELALLLGASRPKVNAALMTLEKSGAIRRADQGFACDARLLADFALRDPLAE